MPLLENKIIAIENVWLSYTDKNILEDINLDIYQGDFLLITGPNGGGKTSLLRTILRLQSPTKGQITFFRQGEPVSSLDGAAGIQKVKSMRTFQYDMIRQLIILK